MSNLHKYYAEFSGEKEIVTAEPQEKIKPEPSSELSNLHQYIHTAHHMLSHDGRILGIQSASLLSDLIFFLRLCTALWSAAGPVTAL